MDEATESNLETCKESLQVRALPESEDVAEELAEISAAGLKGVAVGLRAHISDLTRRLAEAEAGERNARRHALDLEKIERELTERLESAEARVRELEAFKTRVMAWAPERCECCEHRDRPRTCDACWTCTDHEDKPNWTPPQAWEVVL